MQREAAPMRPFEVQPSAERRSRASPRSRKQCRPGSPSPQKENAARRGVPRNEAPPELRKALRAARPREGRGGAPLSQAPAQAHRARGVLGPVKMLNLRAIADYILPPPIIMVDYDPGIDRPRTEELHRL